MRRIALLIIVFRLAVFRLAVFCLAVFCLAGLAAAPHGQAAAAGAAAPRLQIPVTRFTLPNGLRVILHEDHTVPLMTVNVWYHDGS
ncbi:MAG: hypothetical protein HOQ29_18500, partial [Acidobacteria bacterium]|nr:hypothetical protein [Acidobacteriota bacterium]